MATVARDNKAWMWEAVQEARGERASAADTFECIDCLPANQDCYESEPETLRCARVFA